MSKVKRVVKFIYESSVDEIDVNDVDERKEEYGTKDSTWTVTFSERVENHVGMQIIGGLAEKGFTIEELNNLEEKCKRLGCKVENINIENSLEEEFRNEITKANILIVRGGVKILLGDDYK